MYHKMVYVLGDCQNNTDNNKAYARAHTGKQMSTLAQFGMRSSLQKKTKHDNHSTLHFEHEWDIYIYICTQACLEKVGTDRGEGERGRKV